MKGVVFNIVEEVIEETLPDDAWDAAIVGSGVDGAYTSLGDYADSDLVARRGRVAVVEVDEVDLDLREAVVHRTNRHDFPVRQRKYRFRYRRRPALGCQ